MRHVIAAAGLVALMLSAGPAWAGERTVTLAVDNISCASCPYIVKRTLANVPGVSDVEVSFEERTAVVTFDDAKTDVAALTQATQSMGFPSRLVPQGG
jgi:mercuric ion binding protein